jgi:sensor histidine kinase YesM
VKHNEISETSPLEVDIELTDNHLIIRNRLKQKRNLQHSSKIGLKNLDERFRLITGKNIISGKTEDGFFKVEFPLIPIKS